MELARTSCALRGAVECPSTYIAGYQLTLRSETERGMEDIVLVLIRHGSHDLKIPSLQEHLDSIDLQV